MRSGDSGLRNRRVIIFMEGKDYVEVEVRFLEVEGLLVKWREVDFDWEVILGRWLSFVSLV